MTVTASGTSRWTDRVQVGAAARSRDAAIDSMRGIAILMVIAIHSLPRTGSPEVTAVDAILRPCVPIFLFASGYLSAQARRIPLGKRVKRTLVPYTIAFAAAYLFMAAQNPAMDHRPAVFVARYAFAYVLVYYYVFVYVGCTVLLWLIVAIAGDDDKGRTERLAALLGLAIAIGLVAGGYLDPLLERLGVSASVVEEARMRDIPFWFTFVALGMFAGLDGLQPLLRHWRFPLMVLTLVAYAAYAAIRVIGLGDAADYDSLAFFLYAALLCVTLLGFGVEWPALAALGAASYFIYLWHIFIVMGLRAWPALQSQAVLSSLIKFSVALVITAAIAVGIRSVSPRLAQWLGA
jgi:fucose 4-O-acetylase-like acetyltransferase